MALSAGTRLGPYEIVGPLGAGGMNVDAVRDQFAVTHDGQRFLFQVPVSQGERVPITVVLNWTATIQR